MGHMYQYVQEGEDPLPKIIWGGATGKIRLILSSILRIDKSTHFRKWGGSAKNFNALATVQIFDGGLSQIHV